MSLQVIFARDYLKTTRIGEKQVKYIVEQARRGKVQGHRAELFAVSDIPSSIGADAGIDME